MPIHDWTRVEAGIFHDFHHEWISIIRRALNDGLLPSAYYALAEQQAAGFGPDVRTLQSTQSETQDESRSDESSDGGGLLLAPPRVRFTAQTKGEFLRRKKSTITIRHVSGHTIVAVIEVVSPGNKGSQAAFKALIGKATELLEHKIHLLILDLFPPTKRDPHGIHSALWDVLNEETFIPPADKPLTLAAYESDHTITAYIEPVAVGDILPDMPLFLEPGAHVPVPLETTYQAAWEAVPAVWRDVVAATS